MPLNFLRIKAVSVPSDKYQKNPIHVLTPSPVIPGRFCQQANFLPGEPTCCLPCPATEWTYPHSFETADVVTGWFSIVGLILMAFMLISYLVLPTQKTRSHYLSVCLIVSIMMMSIGFTIPLGTHPEECINEITPNDMYTSMNCAWSGAFIIAGGLCAVMWILIRALSMNLQICWDIVPGKRFFYISQLVGWGLPAILFAITMTVTGVSYRLGKACHVNHDNSMGAFWGPLMFMAGCAGILQVATFGYCIHVYLKNLWTEQEQHSTAASSSGLPSHHGSIRAQTARAVYQRLKKVLWLQWRGIFIVTIILVDVIYFSVIFVYLDGLQSSIGKDWEKVGSWILCLVSHPDDRDVCLHLVDAWLVNEATVISVLVLLAVTGIQAFLLLARPSLFTAWVDLIRSGRSGHSDFVDLDAANGGVSLPASKHEAVHPRGNSSGTFEMQSKEIQVSTRPVSPLTTSGDSRTGVNPFDTHESKSSGRRSLASSPPTGLSFSSPTSRQMQSPQSRTDYFPRMEAGKTNPSAAGTTAANSDERQYHAPRKSFSTPSRKSSVHSVGTVTGDEYGPRGGLGLNPPSEPSESPRDEFPPSHVRLR